MAMDYLATCHDLALVSLSQTYPIHKPARKGLVNCAHPESVRLEISWHQSYCRTLCFNFVIDRNGYLSTKKKLNKS